MKMLRKCDLCDYKCFTKIELKAHLRTHRNLQCGVCQKIFGNSIALTQHKKRHLEDIYCHVCQQRFSKNDRLYRHMEIHKPCMCGKWFPDERALKLHKKTRKVCELCKKSFRSCSYLSRHMTEHALSKCYSCGQCFLNDQALELHKKTCKCSVCSQCFPNDQAMKLHKKRTHYVQCEFCQKSFSSKYYLSGHVRKHAEGKPYKCHEQEPKPHKRPHTVQCEVCKKSLCSIYELPRHMRTCHNVKTSYQCEICNELFNNRNGLNNHQRKHTEDVLYKRVIFNKYVQKLYHCNGCNQFCINVKAHQETCQLQYYLKFLRPRSGQQQTQMKETFYVCTQYKVEKTDENLPLGGQTFRVKYSW